MDLRKSETLSREHPAARIPLVEEGKEPTEGGLAAQGSCQTGSYSYTTQTSQTLCIGFGVDFGY